MEYYDTSNPFVAADRRARRGTRVYPIVKRFVETILALILLILLAPLLLLLSAAVRLNSPGPTIFRQVRIGRDGKPFTCYKFRSMYSGIDSSTHLAFLSAFVKNDLTGVADDQPIFKPVKSDQVTAVGRFLRKSSLDELPQLINVIKGDMSFIGPRPNVPAEVEAYQSWHRRRLEIMPGITGLAQVNGRSGISFDQIVEYDIAYIENESLMLDLRILRQTVPLVLRGKGAK